MWEFNGLPLHVLVVHAAVVFGPLAALAALGYVGLQRHRDLLRWVALVVVLIAFVTIWAAYYSGTNFFASDRFDHVGGELEDKIKNHEHLAGILRWVTTGFTAVTLVAVWKHTRTGALRWVIDGLVVVGAVATLVYLALTGDAGAQAVWGS